MISLYIREIEDYFLRENFRKLKDFLGLEPILSGEFKFFEITVTGNKTNLPYKHNLSFTPKDVIQTSAVFSGGVGTVTWNFSLFDAQFIYTSTAGMGAADTCVVRALVGRF